MKNVFQICSDFFRFIFQMNLIYFSSFLNVYQIILKIYFQMFFQYCFQFFFFKIFKILSFFQNCVFQFFPNVFKNWTSCFSNVWNVFNYFWMLISNYFKIFSNIFFSFLLILSVTAAVYKWKTLLLKWIKVRCYATVIQNESFIFLLKFLEYLIPSKQLLHSITSQE